MKQTSCRTRLSTLSDCRLSDHRDMLTLKRSRALSEMVLLSLRESRSTFFVKIACQTCTYAQQ